MVSCQLTLHLILSSIIQSELLAIPNSAVLGWGRRYLFRWPQSDIK